MWKYDETENFEKTHLDSLCEDSSEKRRVVDMEMRGSGQKQKNPDG